MPFVPNSPETLFEMIREMGYNSFDELYDKAVPRRVQFDGCLNLPKPMSEMEVLEHLKRLSVRNNSTEQLHNFIGAGIYDHYVPAAVERITSRSEFYTAYTPYQAEVSQGTLTAIFEFQSMITALTGMEVANASVYDGGSACAEAVNMALNIRRKANKILISDGVNPLYRNVIETYTRGRKIELVDIPLNENGQTDLDALKDMLDDDKSIGGVLLQNPNFFGIIEDGFSAKEAIKGSKAIFIVSANPISLGFLTPPGEYGADIVVGEAQSLGNRMNFGGPCLGYFASTNKYVRRMPGRIAGLTVDKDGKRGVVLTYQTREQHIRREKATSNICTNQQLLALAATVYMALLGDRGIKETAELCFNKAHYLAKHLKEIKGVEFVYPNAKFFNEFAIKTPAKAKELIQNLSYHGILAGADLSRFYQEKEKEILIAVTEKRSKEEIDYFVDSLKRGLEK
ncbi:MAG: aminomethyl-transferring glycine dehydrogenase subunit GcvPA [Candidatus Zixiibacteriota bacterium]